MRIIGLMGGLLGFLLAVAAAALFAAQFMPGAWYTALQKPEWTPPNSIFAPVWTTLYVLIALAGWLVWWRGKPVEALAWRPLSWWGIGLIFNAMWSWLFFGQHLIGAALIDIAALWCTIVAFIVAARGISPLASLLFVPYLAWVSLATVLNFTIWRLNM